MFSILNRSLLLILPCCADQTLVGAPCSDTITSPPSRCPLGKRVSNDARKQVIDEYNYAATRTHTCSKRDTVLWVRNTVRNTVLQHCNTVHVQQCYTYCAKLHCNTVRVQQSCTHCNTSTLQHCARARSISGKVTTSWLDYPSTLSAGAYIICHVIAADVVSSGLENYKPSLNTTFNFLRNENMQVGW